MATATTIELTLNLEEYKALMFAMHAWRTTVESFPIVPEGRSRGEVREMRRAVFALDERVQELGTMYGLPRP